MAGNNGWLLALMGWRNLSRRKYRSLSMVGVLAVGIMALMLIASLSTSIENTLGENVYDLLSSDIIITPDSDSGDVMITDADRCIDEILERNGVKAAAPRIEAEGLISSGTGWRNTTGALVYGIDPVRDREVSRLDEYLVNGGYENFQSSDLEMPPIILGSEFLHNSDLSMENGDDEVDAGEQVRLTFGKLRETDGDITPIFMDFVIVAVYESHLPYFDSLTVFIPIQHCRQLLDLNRFDPKANKILVRTESRGKAKAAKEDILETLKEKTGEEFSGRTYNEYRDYYLNDIIATTRPVGYLIVSISLASAILRMAHSSAAAVQERIFDLGILRAIGFTKKMVMKIYLLESGITGLVGGMLGIGCGFAVVFLLGRSSFSLFSLPLSELNLIPSTSFLLSLMLLAVGVGVLSVLGLLVRILRNPSVYLIRVQ